MTSKEVTIMIRYGLGARREPHRVRDDQGSANNVASITRVGSGGYQLGDRRSYDAWGVVRSQQSGGDPKLRYCASLGHKADDETGLVYMRARYYEPGSGRFLSEDPGMQGTNWFEYCGNDPISKGDLSGRSADEIEKFVRALLNRGEISKDFYRDFMNRSTGIRDAVHKAVTKQNFSDAEIEDEILYQSDKYESGLELETDEEIEGDLEAGVDMDEVLLEEEVLIIDTTTGE